LNKLQAPQNLDPPLLLPLLFNSIYFPFAYLSLGFLYSILNLPQGKHVVNKEWDQTVAGLSESASLPQISLLSVKSITENIPEKLILAS
jgi:hypothetical protein